MNEEVFEVRNLDIWQDDILVLFFWMGCVGFGWFIGWTLGSIA